MYLPSGPHLICPDIVLTRTIFTDKRAALLNPRYSRAIHVFEVKVVESITIIFLCYDLSNRETAIKNIMLLSVRTTHILILTKFSAITHKIEIQSHVLENLASVKRLSIKEKQQIKIITLTTD